MSSYDVGFFVFAALATLAALYFWGQLITLAGFLRELRDHPPEPKCKCEARVAALQDRVGEAEDAIGQVANRVKMQRVRNAANHLREEKEPSDPAELKAMLRRKAGLVAGQPAPHAQ